MYLSVFKCRDAVSKLPECRDVRPIRPRNSLRIRRISADATDSVSLWPTEGNAQILDVRTMIREFY